VEGNAAAVEEFERHGMRMVPVLTDGERLFHGWNPEELARFVGVEDKSEKKRLPVAELARRLERIVEAARRAILEAPPGGLDAKVPQRERTVRDLVYHLFRLSAAYRDALETRTYPESWLQETAPAEMQDATALAHYGERARERLAEWWARADAFAGDVETYYGRQSAPELLERTTWHAAQHLRQLYALLEGMGVTPKEPLAKEDFEGLPLPKELW
jgi:hypothetical protein